MSVSAFLWIMAGVACAVLLPFLANLIRKEFPPTAGVGLPPWVRRYLLLLVFSAVVATVTGFMWESQHPGAFLDRATAFLLGFGWESTLEKFLRPKP